MATQIHIENTAKIIGLRLLLARPCHDDHKIAKETVRLPT